MMVTRGIKCINCDYGTCANGVCTKGAFFVVDQKYTGSAWLFNWWVEEATTGRNRGSEAGACVLIAAGDQVMWRVNAHPTHPTLLSADTCATTLRPTTTPQAGL